MPVLPKLQNGHLPCAGPENLATPYAIRFLIALDTLEGLGYAWAMLRELTEDLPCASQY
jgi:hypothetical protein